MKALVKRLLRRLLAASGIDERLDRLELRVGALNTRGNQHLRELELRVRAMNSSPVQHLLAAHYRELRDRGGALPALNDVEFRVHSQNGEDGILLYLFSMLEPGTKTCVEIGGGDGIECNTANLIVNHGWRGMLVDGGAPFQASAHRFYYATARMWPPELVEAWVTAENVNELVREHGFAGDLDLLSIDVDGVDYWIWKAFDCTPPRVVVAEFQWSCGPNESITIPYDPAFVAPDGAATLFSGASLTALTKLGREKGYRLIGCQRAGFNAFFLRDDVGTELFPEVTPAECYDTMMVRRWDPAFLPYLRRHAWAEV